MIHTAVTTQPSKPTPFLPSNFYEAPQYASYRPASVIALEAPPPPLVPLTVGATSKVKPIPQRRTLRTVMFDAEGKLLGAKIDLTTGEITSKQYKDYFEQRPKPRPDPNAFDLDPFWMRMPAAERSTGLARQHDKSRKKQFNGVKMYLQHLHRSEDTALVQETLSLRAATQQFLPVLNEIIESTDQLDMGGNTRGLVRGRLLSMLYHLDYISPATVMGFMECSESECSERHAQRIALRLRVIVNAFVKHAESYPQGPILTPPKKRPCVSAGQRTT